MRFDLGERVLVDQLPITSILEELPCKLMRLWIVVELSFFSVPSADFRFCPSNFCKKSFACPAVTSSNMIPFGDSLFRLLITCCHTTRVAGFLFGPLRFMKSSKKAASVRVGFSDSSASTNPTASSFPRKSGLIPSSQTASSRDGSRFAMQLDRRFSILCLMPSATHHCAHAPKWTVRSLLDARHTLASRTPVWYHLTGYLVCWGLVLSWVPPLLHF